MLDYHSHMNILVEVVTNSFQESGYYWATAYTIHLLIRVENMIIVAFWKLASWQCPLRSKKGISVADTSQLI